MGYIYGIQNNITNLKYIGATKRPIKIRFTEHKSKNKSGQLTKAIQEYGVHNFSLFFVKWVDDNNLIEEELKLITEYNTIYPFGYNTYMSPYNTYTSIGGKSDVGHDKQSTFVKTKYMSNDRINILGEFPRGLSYRKRTRDGRTYELILVRKTGHKSREYCIRYDETDNAKLKHIYTEAIEYLNTLKCEQ